MMTTLTHPETAHLKTAHPETSYSDVQYRDFQYEQTANPVSSIGAARLLRGADSLPWVELAEHLRLHGRLPVLDRSQLTALCTQVKLTGRGGAGFPVAAKLSSLPAVTAAVVVNASESEPASWKDRILLRTVPHLVLDGAVLSARALGAGQVILAVADSQACTVMRNALRQRGDNLRIRIIELTEHPFVAGEARALMQRLSGRRALPPGRRVHPNVAGVDNTPTFASNVETFAQLAILARIGPYRFAQTGSHDEPGTTLLTVGGAVGRPGVMEIPTGTPLAIVLAAAQAAPQLQAVVIGGYHGAWHQPLGAIRLSRTGLHDAGGCIGAGVVLAVDHQTCGLGELARVSTWLAEQSAGQCGPCRFGLPALAKDVQEILAGNPGSVQTAFDHARAIVGRGACAHPDGASRFVVSGLHTLIDEVDTHLHHGGCGRPVIGELPL